MRSLQVVAFAVAASLAAIGAAHAQDATSLKKSMPGQWELSTTERSKTCVVTMKAVSYTHLTLPTKRIV